MLYNLCIFQVISCCLALLAFLPALVSGKLQNEGLLSYLLAAVLVGFTVYVLFLNTDYIQKRKLSPRFRGVNGWFNILQLFHLSLVGVSFSCLVGAAIIPEFVYSDHVTGQLFLNFGFNFNLTFRGGDSNVSAGVNLAPAVYLYLFHHAVRKAEAAENIELDLFKTSSPPRQNNND